MCLALGVVHGSFCTAAEGMALGGPSTLAGHSLARVPDEGSVPGYASSAHLVESEELVVLAEVAVDGRASIVEVLDRKNYVIRRSTNLSRQSHVIAANLDRAFIVVTLFFPDIKLPFLDRLLVPCEVYGIPATIVLNKVDIFRKEFPEQLADFHRIYESAGYPVIETSALTGEGVNELKAAIGSPEDGHICLFSGESGVGKSSIIKALDPSLNPKVGNISLAHLQGRHTTSLYEMYPLSSGGFIIDSPGLRGFGLVHLQMIPTWSTIRRMSASASSSKSI